MREAGSSAYSTQSCLKIKTMSQQELLPDNWIVDSRIDIVDMLLQKEVCGHSLNVIPALA